MGTHCPTGPGKARRLPKRSHITAGHCSPHDFPLRANGQPKQGFSRHCNASSKSMIGSLRCSSHKSRRVFVLPKMSFLRVGSEFSSPPSLAAVIAQRAFAFGLSLGFFGFCCLAHLSAVTLQFFPLFSFNFIVDCLGEAMPVRINQRRPPSSELNVVYVDESPQCLRFVSSQMLTLLLLPWWPPLGEPH